jgi:hypothetical protein
MYFPVPNVLLTVPNVLLTVPKTLFTVPNVFKSNPSAESGGNPFTSLLQQNHINDTTAMKLRLCHVLNFCNS